MEPNAPPETPAKKDKKSQRAIELEAKADELIRQETGGIHPRTLALLNKDFRGAIGKLHAAGFPISRIQQHCKEWGLPISLSTLKRYMHIELGCPPPSRRDTASRKKS